MFYTTRYDMDRNVFYNVKSKEASKYLLISQRRKRSFVISTVIVLIIYEWHYISRSFFKLFVVRTDRVHFSRQHSGRAQWNRYNQGFYAFIAWIYQIFIPNPPQPDLMSPYRYKTARTIIFHRCVSRTDRSST